MAFLPPPPSSDHHHHHNHQYFFQNHHQQQHDHQDTSLTIFSNSQPHFHGGQAPTVTMMNHHEMRSAMMSGCGGEYQGHGGGGGEHDDVSESEDGSHMGGLGEKKKRLSLEQVKTLEKNFEVGNKLEPERKVQLAKALGLQPRQVAIWFQNRRARWKTKQLEKDYNLLKRQFDALKADNDSLLSHNEKLHAQLLALESGATNACTANTQEGGTEFGSINLNAATKSYCWSNNGSEISSDINLGISTTTQPEESPSSNKLQFPSSFLPASLTDLLTSSSSTPKPPHHPHLQDDTFCSLFPGGPSAAAEQPPFWAWAPDHHHHLH